MGLSAIDIISHDDFIYWVDRPGNDEKLASAIDVDKLLSVLPAEVSYAITGDTDYLDVNCDYESVEKLYPVFRFATKDGRELTSPFAFANHMLKSIGITNLLPDDKYTRQDLDEYIGCDYVSFVYKELGWTWVDEGSTDPEGEVCYHTFGADNDVRQYVDGVVNEC